MRWSEAETHKFVKIYLTHNLLWNPENEEYNMKFRRQAAVRQIAAQFKAVSNISLNEREVKTKIRNLRATYLQEVAKIKRRSTSTCTFQPTIKWFADFHKCFKNIRRKNIKEESLCDDQQEIGESESQEVWMPTDDTNLNSDEDPDKDPFTLPPDNNYSIILKTEQDDTKPSEIIQIQTAKTRKRKCKRRSPSIDTSERMFVSIDSDSIAKDDEFDIYGKYIASQLRRMGLERALRVQLQIQSLVSEARIEHLSDSQ